MSEVVVHSHFHALLTPQQGRIGTRVRVELEMNHWNVEWKSFVVHNEVLIRVRPYEIYPCCQYLLQTSSSKTAFHL